jgi:hypothetical protein
MVKVKEKFVEFSHYVKEVLRANEPFIAELQKNIPNFLTNFIETLVEGSIILDHLRDTQAVKKGRLIMFEVSMQEHYKVIHDAKY